MIKNNSQMAITKSHIKDLELEISNLNIADYKTKFEYDFIENSLTFKLNQLKNSLIEYEGIIKGNLSSILNKNIKELSEILIKSRIAKGMNQKQLGELVGVKEQQIQRYESTSYETASWARIVHIITALDIEITIDKIVNENNKILKYQLPIDAHELEILKSEKRIRKSKSLFFNKVA